MRDAPPLGMSGGVTAAVELALLVWGRWVNLTRPIERGYAAITTARAGG